MLLDIVKLYGRRNFSRSHICKNLEKSKVSEPASTSPASAETAGVTTDFIPTEWDKKILVWSGRYKLKDIPRRISFATLDNAKSKLRIKVANFLMVATLALCGYYVWVGKESKKRGDSFINREIERQKAFSSIRNE